MKKKRPSQSGFFNSRVLLGLVLGSVGVLLALVGFDMSSGASALAQVSRQNGDPVAVSAKIAPDVLAATAEGKSASVVIFLADQAGVDAAYAMKDQDARGWFVYNTLTQHAARTQASLKAFLTAQGASYQTFWVANMIVATAGRSLVESLAARADVARIDSNKPARWIEDPEIANFGIAPGSPTVPETVEWGVMNVNAPSVWALGFTGQGMVVGDLDTGQRWTHNALKPKYRGWNGTAADHNFNWHDAIHSGGGSCGPNTVAPCDDFGHGTHTAGTTVGDDGSGNQIGVAPGAKWIACRNMDQGNGTPATYTECFQFMIAPTDLAGNNANPALRPHVLNNSWGCPASEGCVTRAELETIVNNTQAAGIFVEVSAGNSGPSCSSVTDAPAIYSASFSTGAIDISNVLVSFSSRGPSTYYTPNLLKPNISAPGVNVRSTLRTSDSSFGNMSGTSMAGPHVVGVVALLWSARPELVRDIDTTKSILQNTANPGVTVSGQTCGGTPTTQIPNNSFGYGRVDALAAVNAVVTSTPTPTPTPVVDPTPPPPPTPTPTITPPCSDPKTLLSEAFDGVTPPALPPGWSATNALGPAPLWVTSDSGLPAPPADSLPTAAFVDDPNVISDKRLDSPDLHLFAGPATTWLTFRQNINLETGDDGGVLEISSNGGAFQDVIAAGGSFIAGGYNATISTQFGSPIGGRPAWTGISLGFITTTLNLPRSSTIALRWRMASDASVAAQGWRVDSVLVTECAEPPPPTPTPPFTPTPPPTPTPTATPTPTPTATPTPAATPTPTPAGTATPTPAPAAQAINLSTRMRVQAGDNVGIGGFIITGAAPKHVLLRAIGPSLTGSGVSDALADPVLELHGPGTFVTVTNNNWRDDQEAEIQATGIPPTNDLESAIAAMLTPGAYTAIVRGNGNSSGLALVEVYDLDQAASSKLANLSTRAFVSTGDDIVIAGFILGGNPPQAGNDRIVVRGIGPSLTAFGVPNALADPTLELRDSDGALLIANNDWQDDPINQGFELIALGLAPSNPLESGIVATLPPGLYTALLAGRNNGTGVGLVEIYDRPGP